MKIHFIPIDYDYFDWHGKNYINVIGRDEKGKRISIIDSCDIFFWAIPDQNLSEKELNKLVEQTSKIQLDLKGRKTRVEKVQLHEKNFLGKPVKAMKIFATNYKDLQDIAEQLDNKKIEKRRGYDLGFITHYIIEKKLVPMNWYEIEGEVLNNSEEFGGIDQYQNVDLCLKVNSIKHSKEEHKFKPKVLSFDIETDELKIGEGEILMVSLASDKEKKLITWKKTPEKLDYVEYVKDEAELIERFCEYVKEISPDFLVGYFSDGFDLPYFKARAEKFRIKLNLGLDDSQPKFSRGIEIRGRINGIVHVDLIKFIRTAYSQYMQSESLSLNEVAKEFLGDEKKKFAFKHSSKINGKDWTEYFEYNLHDANLTLQLFEKMWPDILEFSSVMKEPIFEVTRNGMSKNVESYILHNLEKYNEIPERKPKHNEIGERKNKGKYEGAFVYEPTPGLYENISLFDFTSSYGSVIVTYNLSKSTFLESPTDKKNTYHIQSNGEELFFDKTEGFVPHMLRQIIELRKKYKKELAEKPDVFKKSRSNAFKLLANAYYGYQGFFGARYYCREAAAATAGFARKSIKDAIEEINKAGYTTIYSDTDSIAFLMNGKTETQVLQFLKEINSHLPGIMELELEGFFRRGIWVTTRAGTAGAKKKYALVEKNGRLKIRGFETVRRDWCKLAREVQNDVIKLVLEDGNEKRALALVKETISKLKQRKISKEQLIIRTQIKKDLAEYKSISPHVVAAKKMKERELPVGEGNLVEYYLAQVQGKSKLIRDKVKLPDEQGEYDIEYYLNNQILPAVENIFQLFKINTQEIIEGNKQTKLF